MTAHSAEVIFKAAVDPIKLEEKPESKKPIKKTSANNGAAIIRAIHSNHTGSAFR